MFEELSHKFEDALKSLKGENKLTETNLAPALKVVKKALLDADVNLQVIQEFLVDIKNKAIGTEVVRGITPQQKLVEVVHKQLIELMGNQNNPIDIDKYPLIIMLVGLQGAGKTTATAKLALKLKETGRNILMVGGDTFRPAAKDQLLTLGEQIRIDVFTDFDSLKTSLDIAKESLQYAKTNKYDIILLDTAGRLYIDEIMMKELKVIKNVIEPSEVILVVDSMMGQEAAELAKKFDSEVGITGAILTKMDGDTRGGAALSIKQVSGVSIKYIGTGEKVEALEEFHPKRLAGRILGMGDVISLVEKAQKEVSINDVLEMQKKFQEASFDFNDFLKQMKLISRMGSIGGLVKMLPGVKKIDNLTLQKGEDQLKRIQSMIYSMTSEERNNPLLLLKSSKRRRRVAFGSGRSESEVDKMISDFEKMKNMMQSISSGKFPILEKMYQKHESQANISQSTKTHNPDSFTPKNKSVKKRKGFFDM